LKKATILILNLYFVVFWGGLSVAQQPVPQNARQALLEMFFGKTPGTFEKHLPLATKAALQTARTKSGLSMLNGLSMLTSQMAARGQQLQTFEAGPTLVLIDDPQTQSKFEITVERDDLRGDEDEIDLSFHGTKNGEPQTAGAKLGLSFTMKQETKIWRLSQISLTVGVSLTDPDFLKAMTAKLSPGISETATGHTAAPVGMNAMMIAANESAAVAGVRALNTAEISYYATFPVHGFTCTLSDLGGMGSGGGMTERQAMLIDPRLASGKKNGYVFNLTGCDGPPATRYSITAEPANPTAGTRAFCSDDSHIIHFSADGRANSCLNAGTPLQ